MKQFLLRNIFTVFFFTDYLQLYTSSNAKVMGSKDLAVNYFDTFLVGEMGAEVV